MVPESEGQPCWPAIPGIHFQRPVFPVNSFHVFWFFSVTMSMRILLMAFSSERGLQGCRVGLWTGRDGELEGAQQRSGVLAAAHARNWGRGRRGAGWRPYAV